MARKRWRRHRRILRRLLSRQNPAKAIYQWASKPSRNLLKLRRFRSAIRFANNRKRKFPRGSRRRRWWAARQHAWYNKAEQLEDKIRPEFRVIPRSAWDSGSRATAPMSNDSDGLFVHHTVSGSPTTREGEKAEMRNLKQIALSRGFADFSYSFAIFQSGRIYEGRGRGIEGAHTIGYNDTSHAAAAAGNYETQEPTQAMIDAYRWLRRNYLGAGNKPLRGHREVSQTACPGKNLYARLEDI